MEQQATQKNTRPVASSQWSRNDHYFEENPEHSERSQPPTAVRQRDSHTTPNHKQPTWESEADDYPERERASQSGRFAHDQRTPPAHPSRTEMKSRNLRNATPTRPPGRNDPPQQIDPITNLPKPQRFAPAQPLAAKSQQGQRAARETFGELAQAQADKRYARVTRPELPHFGERFLPPLQPAPSLSSQKSSPYQREMSTLE
jgi:hypothetical protein